MTSAKRGAKRPGRYTGKKWSCWRSRSESVKREQRALEKRERQAGREEAKRGREDL